MNTVAIIGDCHFDLFGHNFTNNQLKFFSDLLIPSCKGRGVDTLIFEGDIFENRKQVTTYVNNEVLNLFKETLKEFKCYVIIGNHDTFFKTQNEVNSLKYLGLLPNVILIETITEYKIKNRDVLFVPWIVNYDDFENYIKTINPSKYDLLVGHFDVIKAKMSKSKLSEVGLEKNVLSKFKLIFSGHYHSMSIEKIKDSELIYTGTPYSLNRSDIDESKFFFIVDFKTMKYEMIENTISTKFVQIVYPEEPTENIIKNNIVDVYLKSELNSEDVQEYLKKINSFEPFQPPVTRFLDNVSFANKEEIEIKSLDDMFVEYISTLNIEDEIRADVTDEIMVLFDMCKRDEIK